MVCTCNVQNCKSEWFPNCGLSFHTFPTDPIKRDEWLKIVPIKRPLNETSKICSRHFKKTDYKASKRLYKDAVPVFIEPDTNSNSNNIVQAKMPANNTSQQGNGYQENIKIIENVKFIPTPPKIYRVVSIAEANRLLQNGRIQVKIPAAKTSQQEDGYQENVKIEKNTENTPNQTKLLQIDPENTSNLPKLFQIVTNNNVQATVSAAKTSQPEDRYQENVKIEEFVNEDKTPVKIEQLEEEEEFVNTGIQAKTLLQQEAEDAARIPTVLEKSQKKNTAMQMFVNNGIQAKTQEEEDIPIPLQKSQKFANKGTQIKMKTPREVVLKRRNKLLAQKVYRLKRIIKKKNAVISTMKSYTDNSELQNMLYGNYEKICRLLKKKPRHQMRYSDEEKAFALTLRGISAKAYTFLQKYMVMPHIETLRRLSILSSTNSGVEQIDSNITKGDVPEVDMEFIDETYNRNQRKLVGD